jgi:hypothetical protein
VTTPELISTDTIAPLEPSITGCVTSGVFHALDAANGRQTPAGAGTAIAAVAPVVGGAGVATRFGDDTFGIVDTEDGRDDAVGAIFFATVDDEVDRDDGDDDDRVVVVDDALCALARRCAREWPRCHRVSGVPAAAATRMPTSRQVTAASRACRERRARAAAKRAARPPRRTCACNSVSTERAPRDLEWFFPRLFVRIINPCRPFATVRQSSNGEC